MASRIERLRKEVLEEGSALVGHSLNQRDLKDAMDRLRRGKSAKKVLRAQERRIRQSGT